MGKRQNDGNVELNDESGTLIAMDRSGHDFVGTGHMGGNNYRERLRIRVTVALANGRVACSPEGREAHQLCVPTPEHRAMLASELTVRSCCDQGREGCA